MEDKLIIRGSFQKQYYALYSFIIGAISLLFAWFFFADDQLGLMIFFSSIGSISISLAIAALILFGVGVFELAVTEKRVSGKIKFWKNVDLPVDSITAIGFGIFQSITITTASGAIYFPFLNNKYAVYNELLKLIMARQDNSKTNCNSQMSVSNADELKKFKSLTDEGVITQEEFEAKKKQLLGL